MAIEDFDAVVGDKVSLDWLRYTHELPMILFLFLAMSLVIDAQDPRAEDRKALLKILDEVQAGINTQNVEGILKQMDPGATVTWWNGEVSHGEKEIRAYYQKMMKDEGRILDRMTVNAKLDGHARFLGDGSIAIADGSSEDEFFPKIRGPFKLNSRWSSTVAKIDGQWKIVNMHLSANVFTNSLIAEALRSALYVGVGALLVGALLGWFVRRWMAS